MLDSPPHPHSSALMFLRIPPPGLPHFLFCWTVFWSPCLRICNFFFSLQFPPFPCNTLYFYSPQNHSTLSFGIFLFGVWSKAHPCSFVSSLDVLARLSSLTFFTNPLLSGACFQGSPFLHCFVSVCPLTQVFTLCLLPSSPFPVVRSAVVGVPYFFFSLIESIPPILTLKRGIPFSPVVDVFGQGDARKRKTQLLILVSRPSFP